MNRNANSHFALNPTSIDISRSKFNRSFNIKTSFNAGDLIPFVVDEVLPGDTYQVKTSKVVRMQPLVSSPLDDISCDTYYFFVPSRLVWNHWAEFNGENTESAWTPTTEYEIPQITSPVGGWSEGTIADYMGIPTKTDNISVSSLPFRAYALICNEWFRSEAIQNPVNVPVNDSTIAGSNGSDQVTDIVKGGKPFIVNKYFDYFTGCLPSPQRGPDVTLPIDGAPVVTGDIRTDYYPDQSMRYTLVNNTSSGITLDSSMAYFPAANPSLTTTLQPGERANLKAQYLTMGNYPQSQFTIAPNNLQVDDVNITINALRQAFQIQKLYEKDARGGGRYVSNIKTHFGVVCPDYRVQRPEYLGGNRIRININSSVSTVATSNTPQANVAGYSLTSDSHGDFIHSFTEHGFVIGLMCTRYNHTYQQGLNRMWSRKDRFDFYLPVLANLGEMPVLNKEIYCSGTSTDDEVFGYQEAWAEYRYKPSMCTGLMRSNATASLDSWHFGDDYSSLPHLSDSWLREDKSNLDRVLAVTSSVTDQFFSDIYVSMICTRPMPTYSIPGLIDHH